MDLKEIDLSRDDGYTCNVDLTKEELDWVYAYLQLTEDGSGVGREILHKVCKNVESFDEAKASCMRLVMWAASRLLRDGERGLKVATLDGLSIDCTGVAESDGDVGYGRGNGFRDDMKTLGRDDVESVAVMAKMKSACEYYGEDFTALVHRMGYMSSLDCIRMFQLMNWFLDMLARGLLAWPKGGDSPMVETRQRVYQTIITNEEKWSGEDDYQDKVERGYYATTEGVDDESEMCNPFKTISDLTDEQVERIKASFLKNTLNSIYGASATKTVHPDEDCVLPGCNRYGGNDTYLRIRKVLGHKGAFDFCMGNVIKLVDRWEKKGDPAQNLEKLRDYSAQALVEWRLWNEKLS